MDQDSRASSIQQKFPNFTTSKKYKITNIRHTSQAVATIASMSWTWQQIKNVYKWLKSCIYFIPTARSGMFIPDPNFLHPGSASKKISILTQKIVSKLSQTMIRVVHPGSGFFTHPGSRGQKGSRIRIRNIAHCCRVTKIYFTKQNQLTRKGTI